MSSTRMTDEYLSFYLEAIKKYGTNTCVLMQVGTFYEVLQVKNENENIGNVDTISGLLNIQPTKINKTKTIVNRNNPLMCGFPKVAIQKFLPLLLNNGYTIVLVDQTDDISNKRTERKISAVYSPGAPPLDGTSCCEGKDPVLLSILLDKFQSSSNSAVGVGISSVELTTGYTEVFDTCSGSLSDLVELLYTHIKKVAPSEIIFNLIGCYSEISQKELFDSLDLQNINVHSQLQSIDKSKEKIEYQNKYFHNVFFNDSSNPVGMLTPIEVLDIERLTFARLSLMSLLDFVYEHNETYIKQLKRPVVYNSCNQLVLVANTINQLNVLPLKGTVDTNSNTKFDSLYSVVNGCSTAIGKRKLKKLLCQPFTDPLEIQKRYDLTHDFSQLNFLRSEASKSTTNSCSVIDKLMDGILDLERLYRKMALGVLNPSEFLSMINVHKYVDELRNKIINDNGFANLKSLQEIVSCYFGEVDYTNFQDFTGRALEYFHLEHMESDFVVNFFKEGINDRLDAFSKEVQDTKSSLQSICDKFNAVLNVKDGAKLAFTEAEGYYIQMTNVRGEVLKKQQKTFSEMYVFKTLKGGTKVTSEGIEKLSSILVSSKEKLSSLLMQEYKRIVMEMYQKYCGTFQNIVFFIEVIDLTKSNLKISNKFKFTRPQICYDNIDDTDNQPVSFIEAVQLRHPIIERILESTEYVPNDVCLGSKGGPNGIVLYALNAAGKSSLLRSVGLSIILAQIGYYVPASSFKFYPFKILTSQVDLYDNLFKAQSSFVTEMVSLRNILNKSDAYTLVLADELCKGSEIVSATAIFASAINFLSERNVKFLFTTHLHLVSEIQSVNKNKRIRICHLSVQITADKKIVFCRKLLDGPCESLYGLEVAKALDLDSNFIKEAFSIRDKLVKKKGGILGVKKSIYNSKKIVDKCEICNYYPHTQTDIPLDTHHIKFQCTADSTGYIGNYNKNAQHNLVILCKKCHVDVHKERIVIDGYVQSLGGVILQWRNVPT